MPIVTISRQFGAGGKTLGNMLSKRLEYAYVEDDIIQLIAKKARVSTGTVHSMEKEAGSTLQKWMSGLVRRSFVERILSDERGFMDEEIYVDLLRTIISQIAAEGNTVILGRGSQYILRDSPNTFHILLVADLEDRIRFMEKNYDLTTKEALHVITRQDKRRANLYRKFGKEDYDQPDLYHLVLNMSKLNLDKAVDLACKLVVA